ncbi:MAG TPA: DUF1990 domain-containing protein, partial [Streptosporangiaceae bacterium]|nr:DUF1990 domain-containing protein [Streptosporangiaceae bacterium]
MPITLMPAGMADRLAAAELTYREAGQTAAGTLPPGYHHLRRTIAAGRGRDAFAAATQTLLGWQVQRRAGLRVTPSSATVQLGSVVLLGLGVGPLRINAPCRVVYTVDEPGSKGFAYGTLPGHPESGEEAFIVELRADGLVTFTITAFSRPATALARAAGPVERAIQHQITGRYLRALTAGRTNVPKPR